jgi:hypothetical protein
MSGESTIPLTRIFGISPETESSFEDFLCEAHRDFILAYIEAAQAREEAVISQLLEQCP